MHFTIFNTMLCGSITSSTYSIEEIRPVRVAPVVQNETSQHIIIRYLKFFLFLIIFPYIKLGAYKKILKINYKSFICTVTIFSWMSLTRDVLLYYLQPSFLACRLRISYFPTGAIVVDTIAVVMAVFMAIKLFRNELMGYDTLVMFSALFGSCYTVWLMDELAPHTPEYTSLDPYIGWAIDTSRTKYFPSCFHKVLQYKMMILTAISAVNFWSAQIRIGMFLGPLCKLPIDSSKFRSRVHKARCTLYDVIQSITEEEDPRSPAPDRTLEMVSSICHDSAALSPKSSSVKRPSIASQKSSKEKSSVTESTAYIASPEDVASGSQTNEELPVESKSETEDQTEETHLDLEPKLDDNEGECSEIIVLKHYLESPLMTENIDFDITAYEGSSGSSIMEEENKLEERNPFLPF